MTSDKYKVVQLSSVHPSHDTRIFYKICKTLVAHGFDLDLIIQHPNDEVKDGVNIIALPIAKKKADRIFKIIPKLFLKAIKYPKKTIFHFHDPELIPAGYILKILGYKVIYDVHEDVPKDILTKDWIPKYARKALSRIVHFIEDKIAKKADAVITVVPALSGRFKGNALEIRNYPIIKASTPPIMGKKNYVVYVGSLTERRGLINMIKAVNVTRNQVNFKIGGSFGNDSFKNKLYDLSINNKVDFLGWVNQDEFQIIMGDAMAGLLTLKNIPSHIVSYPVKLFEYMLHGLPVIASDFPLWREIIEGSNCGILVDSELPEEISNAIDWIFEHPKEAHKMGENGRRAVLEKYNWANEEKKLIKLYNNLS